MNIDDKNLVEIFTEMCKRVGAPLSIVNSQKDWFQKYTWTEKQYVSFQKWLVKYFLKHREFSGIKTKEVAESMAFWFLLDFGWSIRRE